jgi:hypothetical protein
MREAVVTVTMNPLELKLFRRALAEAADKELLGRTAALNRICELDNLRWEAEDNEQLTEDSGQSEEQLILQRRQNARGQLVLERVGDGHKPPPGKFRTGGA